MKHGVCFALLLVLMTTKLCAQWKPQTSPTKNNLNDVAFLGTRLGYAVGENGTVLKTLNGGKTWQLVTAPSKESITSVTIIDSNTVMVTTTANAGEGAVYESKDQGNKWVRTLTDTRTFYGAAAPHKNLYSTSSQIYKSTDIGRTWQPQEALNGTSTYTQIEFADEQTGMVTGNVSGIVTYSADFWRTVTGGVKWYRGNSFSFPNANAFSTLDMLSPDSVLMFTNFYNRFLPGDSNSLILLTNFRLRRDFVDSIWYFDTRNITTVFPDRLSDCKFFLTGKGFTTSETGRIYTTSSFGKKWKPDYNGKTPLHALYMVNEEVGFAVGDSGLILKKEAVADTLKANRLIAVNVYPNPAATNATISFKLDKAAKIIVEIRNAQGNTAMVLPAKNYNSGVQQITLQLSNLQRGVYHASIISEGKTIGKSELAIMR